MLLGTTSGKTSSDEMRATKPIGALQIKTSRAIRNMDMETITIYVEQDNGNLEICSNVPLRDFILGSVYLDGHILEGDEGNGCTALCELAEGAIELGERESIKIKLDNLSPLDEYKVWGLEYPQFADDDEIITYETRRLLSDEKQRAMNVEDFDLMIINNFQAFRNLDTLYENDVRNSYTNDELRQISYDIKGSYGFSTDGSAVMIIGDVVVYPLVGVREIDIKKVTGTMDLTFATFND